MKTEKVTENKIYIQKTNELIYSKTDKKKDKRPVKLLKEIKKTNLDLFNKITQGRVTEFGEGIVNARQPLLNVCVEHNYIESIKFFVKNKVDINGEDYNKKQPLWIAAFNGNSEIVDYLLKNKANVNQKNYRYGSALHAALGEKTLKLSKH